MLSSNTCFFSEKQSYSHVILLRDLCSVSKCLVFFCLGPCDPAYC